MKTKMYIWKRLIGDLDCLEPKWPEMIDFIYENNLPVIFENLWKVKNMI
jgi:hypothetical protein